ncbi:MAG: hypothetical protein JWO95_2895 [Verrucomicrobiales bacterium]|nr:hypothetical protein [Verrucomicrobiales bacterium]
MDTQILLSICVGIGLSAACGFRVFVPVLALSIGAFTGHLHLAQNFAWIGSKPALVAFAVATVFEICAYYIPFLDNLLDTIAGPTAAIAGILVTASLMADIDPMWRWTFAVIAGGGIAGTTQLATTKLRLASSAATGGMGNHILSTIEAVFSTGLSVFAIVLPVVAVLLVIVILIACWWMIYAVGKRVFRWLRPKPTA